MTGSIARADRRRRILEQARVHGVARLFELADEFDVHEMTIRRDFDALESRGLGRRVRGGFVLTPRTDFQSRVGENNRAKRTIARKLVNLIPTEGSVSFDASTTVYELAKVLNPRGALTVLTNSTATFEELQGRPCITALLSGGESEPENFALTGPVARRSLEEFPADVAVMSTRGIDLDGRTGESTAREADLKHVALSNASHRVLAVDSSKLGSRAPFAGPDLHRFDVLVTELDPGNALLDAVRAQVEVR